MQENQHPRGPVEPPSFQARGSAIRAGNDATIHGRPFLHSTEGIPLNAMPALLLLPALLALRPARADCIDEAALRHGVNGHVLRAIGWHESRLRPDAEALNRNGTRAIGAFQINGVPLPLLARRGVDARALRDGCVSSHVAAWHYARQVARHGNTWRAVGAYHSGTPARSAWYANAIATVLMRW